MKHSDWYFTAFEDRVPPQAQPYNERLLFLYQVLAVASLGLGVWYLSWRWTASLNWEAPGFSLALVIAETLAFFGSVLFTINLWQVRDTRWRSSPRRLSQIVRHAVHDRPLVVDVFLPTFNEEEELVRLSIQDTKKMRVPEGVQCYIHVLDDGCRPLMQAITEQEGVNYIPREESTGFKAGNIRHGMQQTCGDLMVILDADTRPLPAFLERTLGYFRDPDVAWVQTPQWFFDLPAGIPLPDYLAKRWHLGRVGQGLGQVCERLIGPVHIGQDLLGNDPRLFYDVILRRRNAVNASFCCGAGSIHRRDAIMHGALKTWVREASDKAKDLSRNIPNPALRASFFDLTQQEITRQTPLMPYRFHVSEDIYTGMLLHADPEREWKSVYHPESLSKMLSPQDLLSWTVQRFKYAGGTLDIMAHDSPLRYPGMNLRQKMMYGATLYSYLSPLWVVLFLLAPILFFFTGIAPVAAYDATFYMHIIPFLIANRLAIMVATWGVPSLRGEQYYLAFFWQNIGAMWEVICRQPIRFHVTPKTLQSGNFVGLVWPQLTIIALTLLGIGYMGWNVYTGVEKHIPAYIVNVFWSLNNCLALSVIVRAAFFQGESS
jgi:cellulose synthase (UDP-forming)